MYLLGSPDGMDFTNWQCRRFGFIEMAEDAKFRHAHITAYVGNETIFGPAVKSTLSTAEHIVRRLTNSFEVLSHGPGCSIPAQACR